MVWLFVSSSFERRITDVMVPSGFYSFHPGLYFPAKENKKQKRIFAGSHFLKFVSIVRTH